MDSVLIQVASYFSKLYKLGISYYDQSLGDRWSVEDVSRLDPNRYSKWLAGSFKRSQRGNFPHRMTLADFEQLALPLVCPVLNKPTNLGIGDNNFKLSIDRVVPDLGYVPGNVIVISTLANRIKGKRSLRELDEIANRFDA